MVRVRVDRVRRQRRDIFGDIFAGVHAIFTVHISSVASSALDTATDSMFRQDVSEGRLKAISTYQDNLNHEIISQLNKNIKTLNNREKLNSLQHMFNQLGMD